MYVRKSFIVDKFKDYSGLSLQILFKDSHLFCLDLFCNVDVGFHGFIVGVAGPFHHDLRRDVGGQGKADEGAAAGMGADEFVWPMSTSATIPAKKRKDVRKPWP